MYALIALLLFVSMVLVAYVWFTVGIALAIIFPALTSVLVYWIFCDPLLTPGSDRRLFVGMFCGILLFVELALFVGGLLRVLVGA